MTHKRDEFLYYFYKRETFLDEIKRIKIFGVTFLWSKTGIQREIRPSIF